MFEDLLNNQGLNQRFAGAQDNHDAVDPNEAAEYVNQFMRNAPPETQREVFQQYYSQLDPQQRAQLAQAMAQHPDTPVQQVRADDPNDFASALQQSGGALANRGGAGALGGLFGMLGGGQNNQNTSAQNMPQNPGTQSGLGGQLGSLLQNPMARAGLVSLAAVIGSKLLAR